MANSINIAFYGALISASSAFLTLLITIGRFVFGVKKRIKTFNKKKEIDSVKIEFNKKVLNTKKKALVKLRFFRKEISGKIEQQKEKRKKIQINALLRKAKILIERKELSEAEKILIQALTESENHLRTNEMLAQIYFLQEKFWKAEIIFMKLLKKNENNFTVLSQVAQCNEKRNNFAKAIRFFEAALTIKKDPHLYLAIAENLFQMQKKSEAIESIQEAIKIDDHHKEIYYLAADIYKRFGEKEEARDIYRQLIKVFPNDVKAFSFLREMRKK